MLPQSLRHLQATGRDSKQRSNSQACIIRWFTFLRFLLKSDTTLKRSTGLGLHNGFVFLVITARPLRTWTRTRLLCPPRWRKGAGFPDRLERATLSAFVTSVCTAAFDRLRAFIGLVPISGVWLLTSTQLALSGAQSGDMNVPVPPPPDGVLTGTSGSLEAGEPTLGTAVLRGDCPPGPGQSGGTPAQAALLLCAPTSGNLGPLLGAVCVDNLSLCCFLTVCLRVSGWGWVCQEEGRFSENCPILATHEIVWLIWWHYFTRHPSLLQPSQQFQERFKHQCSNASIGWEG